MATNGVIYWKHNPGETDYRGDIQKPDGLCGTDLDHNFHFLRGMDIESVAYSGNTIVITRVSGEELRFEPKLNGKYVMTLSGTTLSITNKEDDEDVISVEGISPAGNWISAVTHDSTLKGDGNGTPLSVNVEAIPVSIYWNTSMEGRGSATSPIGIARNYQTGFYRPVKTVINESQLSDYAVSGTRVVCIETKNEYGYLYDVESKNKIMTDILADTGWRLPSKEDFDTYFYWYATTFDMKSTEGWPSGGSNTSGINLLPTNDSTGDGQLDRAVLWIEPFESSFGGYNGTVYIGDEDKNSVTYDTFGLQTLASIRLVKSNEAGSTVDETQEINGELFQCVAVGDCIWTTSNVDFRGEGINAVIVNGGREYTKHFICEYSNGKWSKKEIAEGESVVVDSYNGVDSHTWRLIDGVLVDMDERDKKEVIGSASDDSSKETVYGAKAYADKVASDLVIDGQGDEYIEVAIADKKKVNVSASDKLVEVIGKAEDALQRVEGSEYVVADAKVGNSQKISVKVGLPEEGGAKLVDAASVKDYVEEKETAINNKINQLSSTTTAQKVTPGDDSIEMNETPGGTTIKVKLSDDDGNIIKLDTHDGLYVNARDLIRYAAGDGLKIGVDDVINLVLDGTSLVKTSNGLKANLMMKAVPASGITNPEIREAWQVVDSLGNVYGDRINVYKDSRFLDAILGHVGGSVTGTASAEGYPYTDGTSAIRALQFIFTTKDGSYSMKEVSLDGYLTITNLGKGLTSRKEDSNALTIVDVLIDPTSETYLTVSNDGVKLDGIKSDIEKAGAKATTVVKLTNSHPHLTLASETATDGHVTYTIGETNIADKDNVYVKKEIDDMVTAITSTMYSVGMSALPNVVFKGSTNNITLSTTFKAFSGNITPTSVKYYSDAARQTEVTSPVSLTMTDTTSMTYYSKVIKDTLTFMSSATVKAYDKVYYGIGTSAEGVVNAGVFASARSSAVGTYTATNRGDGTYRFYLCVPAGVTVPTTFSMNGFGATLTKTTNVGIGGVVYTVFYTDTVGAGQTVKITAA